MCASSHHPYQSSMFFLGDHDSLGMSVSTTSSSPCPSSARSRVDSDSSQCSSSSAQQSHSDSSTSTSSPGSDQGNSSRASITMDLSRRYYEGTIAIGHCFSVSNLVSVQITKAGVSASLCRAAWATSLTRTRSGGCSLSWGRSDPSSSSSGPGKESTVLSVM